MFDIAQLNLQCLDCGRPAQITDDRDRRDDWNVYGFDCGCAGGLQIEVPEALDALARGLPGDRIHLRNLSLVCMVCETYPTLAAFRREDEANVYTYECEGASCQRRRELTVPEPLDQFARRDPAWRGGARHAGAKEPEEPSGDALVVLGGKS
ncbi:MAG: hypothetical protein AAF604_05920 [Acidobacteriota bacterium]